MMYYLSPPGRNARRNKTTVTEQRPMAAWGCTWERGPTTKQREKLLRLEAHSNVLIVVAQI